MTTMQILIGDLHRGHFGSNDITHAFLFANNSRLKKATSISAISLCLSCKDAWTDMQHDLLKSTFDLT